MPDNEMANSHPTMAALHHLPTNVSGCCKYHLGVLVVDKVPFGCAMVDSKKKCPLFEPLLWYRVYSPDAQKWPILRYLVLPR